MGGKSLEGELHELMVSENSHHKIAGIIRVFRPGAHKHTFLRQIKMPDGSTRLTLLKVPKDIMVPVGASKQEINVREHSLDMMRHSQEIMIQGKIGTVFTGIDRPQIFFDPKLGRVEEWGFAGVDLDLASSTKGRFNSKLFQNAVRTAITNTLQVYKKYQIGLDSKLANYTIVPTEKITIKKTVGRGRHIDEGIPLGTGKNGVSYIDLDPEEMTLPDPNEPYKIMPAAIAWRMAKILDQVRQKDQAFNKNTNCTDRLENYTSHEVRELFGPKRSGEIIGHTSRFSQRMATHKKDVDVTIRK